MFLGKYDSNMSIIRKKKLARRRSFARRLVVFVFGIFIFTASAGGGITAGILISFGDEIPNVNKKAPRPIAQTTKVYAADGSWMADFHAEEDRVYTKLDKIPKHIQNAVIAIEDERFYKHSGIDYQGIMRALVSNIKSGGIVEGGSTLTQQFVKNRYLTHEKTYVRKVKEAILAYQLERKLTKKQILEAYLNTIYFGNGVYGVNTAAYRYFGKSLDNVTVGEAAMLAGLIRAPIKYSPYGNADFAKKRRDFVVKRMYDQKRITKREAELALAEPLKLLARERGDTGVAPFFIEHIKQELIKKYGPNAVFKGGLRIFTTLKPDDQKAAEEAVKTTLNRPKDPSASLVSIEPKTGYIRAMVGGRDFQTEKFNLATQGHRQAGSAFKMFVLAAAIQKGFSLNDRLVSAPQSIKFAKDAPIWNVRNYGNKYRGSITLRDATIWSDNTVYAQVIVRVGAANVVKMAHDLGIETDIPATPAIALGGLTTGVSALEMATAGATLANDGVKPKVISINKITDYKGVVIEENEPSSKRVIDYKIARAVNSALKDAMSRGTGKRAIIGRPAAGKTGTAQDYRDAWFNGYTPNLATAVWMGYTHAQIPMRSVHGVQVAGGTFPAEIWRKYMAIATNGLPAIDFPGFVEDKKNKAQPPGDSHKYYRYRGRNYRPVPAPQPAPQPSTPTAPVPPSNQPASPQPQVPVQPAEPAPVPPSPKPKPQPEKPKPKPEPAPPPEPAPAPTPPPVPEPPEPEE